MMKRDKQIEEMQNALIKIAEQPIMIEGLEHWSDVIAEELYNAGYRKAQDVAREIFAEIEDVLNNIGYFDEIDFKALKKKYESEGEG